MMFKSVNLYLVLTVFQLTSTHEGVKRTKYFDDDEKYNLKDLVCVCLSVMQGIEDICINMDKYKHAMSKITLN